jgi:branched-chain amino acid transport system substrate-binding protein
LHAARILKSGAPVALAGLLLSTFGSALAVPAQAAAPINIGVVTSVSGPLADYGQQELRGLKLGIAYATHGTWKVDGRKINLIVRDDTGSPQTGAQQMRSLILQDHVAMVQGPTDSAVAIPMEQLAGEYKVPLVIDPAADDDLTTTYLNPYVFRTAVDTYMYAKAFGVYLNTHGGAKGQTFYQIAPNYVFGTSSVKDWAAALTAAGATNLGVTYAPITTTDFTSYIDHILAMKPLPKELVVTWAGVGAMTLFQQMAQAGLYGKMNVIGAIGGYNGLKALGKSDDGYIGVTDYYYTIPHNAANTYLTQQYEQLYSNPPDLFAGTSFAAGQAIVQALATAKGTSAQKLTKALSGMTIDGPKGPIYIRPQDHMAIQPMYVVKLVWNAGIGYAAPTLVETVSAQQAAPPLPKR